MKPADVAVTASWVEADVPGQREALLALLFGQLPQEQCREQVAA